MKPQKIAQQVELIFSDINGVPRGKIVDASALNSTALPHFAAAVFFQTITGGYAHQAMGVYNPKDEDILIRPDWSTYRSIPWKKSGIAQVIVSSEHKDGKPVAYDPRNVLKRILAMCEEKGLFPIIAPELEFYLLEAPKRGDTQLTRASGFDGRGEFGGEAFSSDAMEKFSPFIEELQQQSIAANLPLSSVLHEMGPAQIELNVEHGDALQRADELFLLKRLVKVVALRHGYIASFMAKPLALLPGSGLHLHCSMLDENGKNLFALNDGVVPDLLRHFIGGLQSYLPKTFPLIAPNVNSYKRFVPDLSAPINLEWGYDNRTTGLRVPYSQDDQGRVESRVSGADANPYLMVAANLACGLLGINGAVEPSEAVETDAYEMTAGLPGDLSQALMGLEGCQPLVDILSKELVDVFCSVKRDEINDFAKDITPWEVSYLGSML